MTESGRCPGAHWACTGRPFPGQRVSGDACIVSGDGEYVLFAVIDGLGHGEKAAAAARLARECLDNARPADSLVHLVADCHAVLRGSRGIALAIARYHPLTHSIQWTGIGNVEAVLWRLADAAAPSRSVLTPRNGVVGYQLPSLKISTVDAAPGDVCCMASDGIASAFAEFPPASADPAGMAEDILARYGKATDDALVLTLHLEGSPH